MDKKILKESIDSILNLISIGLFIALLAIAVQIILSFYPGNIFILLISIILVLFLSMGSSLFIIYKIKINEKKQHQENFKRNMEICMEANKEH